MNTRLCALGWWLNASRRMLLALLLVLGVLGGSTSFELTLHLLPSSSEEQLDELYWRVANPGSSEYLHFLDLDDLAPLVGGKSEAISRAAIFLRGLRGSNVQVSTLRDKVTASFAGVSTHNRELWTARGLPAGGAPAGVALVTRQDVGLKSGLTAELRSNASSLGGYSVARQKRAYKVPAELAATNPRTTQVSKSYAAGGRALGVAVLQSPRHSPVTSV